MSRLTALLLLCLVLLACAGPQAVSTMVPSPESPTATTVPSPTAAPTQAATSLPSPTPLVCNETAGTVSTHTFESAISGQPFSYRLYQPPCYDQFDVRYPYLIMLHGLGAGMDARQWDEIGIDEAASEGYASGELPPMLIVMPDGTTAQHANDAGPYPRIIVEELIPRIEAEYCAWGTPETRAIGGLSRGGYWAYAVAFLHPELFTRVGGHSGYFYSGDVPSANPWDLVGTAPGIEGLTMYLDKGANDSIVGTRVEDFAAQLRSLRNIEPQVVIHPEGGHTVDYWSAHVDEYLDFYAAEWPRDLSQFPSCQ